MFRIVVTATNIPCLQQIGYSTSDDQAIKTPVDTCIGTVVQSAYNVMTIVVFDSLGVVSVWSSDAAARQ
jgi:hypothetical protein